MESNSQQEESVEITVDELARNLYVEFNKVTHPDIRAITWEQLKANPAYANFVDGWTAAANLSFASLTRTEEYYEEEEDEDDS